MMIKSITLHNIRSYTNQSIEFSEGSTLLSGDIGSGKSTMLLALEFAFFGIQRGDVSGSELLRHGKKEGFVELDIDIDGSSIRIRRALRRMNDSVVQDSGFIETNGLREELSPSELKARVYSLVGYPMEMLAKRPVLFRYTVYTPQERMKDILFADAPERLGIIRKIFGIDKYGRIRENAKIVATELRAVQRELLASVSGIDEKKKEITAKRDELVRVCSEVDRAITIAESMRKKVLEKTAEIERWKVRIDAMNKKKQQLAASEAGLHRTRMQLASVSRNEAAAMDAVSRLKSELQLIPDYKAYDMAGMEKEAEQLGKERDGLTRQRAVMLNNITKLMVIFEKGVCETCGQSVHDPQAFEAAIKNEKLGADKIRERMQSIESRLRELSEELKKTHASAIVLEKKRMAEKRLQELGALLESASKEQAALVSEEAGLCADVQRLKAELSAFAEAESRYITLESELGAMQRQYTEGERNLARAEQMKDGIEKIIGLLRKDIEQMENAKAEAERISSIGQWLSAFFMPLTETIEHHVMLTIQQEFNGFFQDWFSVLIEDESLGASVSETFEPVLSQNGYETDYANLSGGEKTSVALAYRLALNKVINELIETIKTKDILILDEPTDGFSAEQLDKIRDVLQQLGLKQVIVVSHEPKMDSFVDRVIRISKEQHVSRAAG